MKTNWIALKTGSLLPLIMAALMTLTIMGCGKEDPPEPVVDRPESEAAYSGNVITQTFWVYPEGTEVSALGGTVWLKFPEGAVSVLTEFTITCFPIHHLEFDGFNMYNRGIHLESGTPNQKLANVMITLNYDLAQENWKKSAPIPLAESFMTIYHVSPNLYAYQRINSIGDCCVDCESKTIQGCISSCGFYVLGEN